MADAAAFRRIEHPFCFGGVAAERPFAVDMLPRLDGRHDRLVVIRHFDADRHQIHIGMPRQFSGVRECKRNLVVPGGGIGGFLPSGADGNDFELR